MLVEVPVPPKCSSVDDSLSMALRPRVTIEIRQNLKDVNFWYSDVCLNYTRKLCFDPFQVGLFLPGVDQRLFILVIRCLSDAKGWYNNQGDSVVT